MPLRRGTILRCALCVACLCGATAASAEPAARTVKPVVPPGQLDRLLRVRNHWPAGTVERDETLRRWVRQVRDASEPLRHKRPQLSSGVVTLAGRLEDPSSLQLLLVAVPMRPDRPPGIPKGGVEPGESLERTARREFAEELGHGIRGPLLDLGEIAYSDGRDKKVHGFGLWLPEPVAMDWVEWAAKPMWLAVREARDEMNRDQWTLVERFLAHLGCDLPP
jgi:8-oxo-dGTP pyrophosphatase MutT (NUDIX family)